MNSTFQTHEPVTAITVRMYPAVSEDDREFAVLGIATANTTVNYFVNPSELFRLAHLVNLAIGNPEINRRQWPAAGAVVCENRMLAEEPF